MRWPRTRYMLMSCWTAMTFSSWVVDRSSGLRSLTQRAGSYGTPKLREDLVVEAVVAEQQLVDRAAGTRRSPRPG